MSLEKFMTSQQVPRVQQCILSLRKVSNEGDADNTKMLLNFFFKFSAQPFWGRQSGTGPSLCCFFFNLFCFVGGFFFGWFFCFCFCFLLLLGVFCVLGYFFVTLLFSSYIVPPDILNTNFWLSVFNCTENCQEGFFEIRGIKRLAFGLKLIKKPKRSNLCWHSFLIHTSNKHS